MYLLPIEAIKHQKTNDIRYSLISCHIWEHHCWIEYIEIYTLHQHCTHILVTSKLLDHWPTTWKISKDLQYVSHILYIAQAPPLLSSEKPSPAWRSSPFWDLFPTASSRHYKIWSAGVPEASEFETLAVFGGNPKELSQHDLCGFQERRHNNWSHRMVRARYPSGSLLGEHVHTSEVNTCNRRGAELVWVVKGDNLVVFQWWERERREKRRGGSASARQWEASIFVSLCSQSFSCAFLTPSLSFSASTKRDDISVAGGG